MKSTQALAPDIAPPRVPPLNGPSASTNAKTDHNNEKSMPKHSNKNDLQHLYRHQQQAIALEHQMALSKNETIFLSSAGDVVICRCRKSHQPQHLHSSTETKSIVSANTVCCEMESVTGEAQQSSFCAPWGSSPSPPSEPATYNIPNPRRSRKSQGGLLGGSPLHADLSQK